MPQWSDYVKYAFGQLGYENYEEGIEPFVERWGGLEREAFARVLKEGQGDDVVLALFAVGSTRSPWARELLLPFLQSTHPMERWASAMSLGRMKEDQAFPVLLSMLTEFFPPKEWPTSLADDLWLYNNWRLQAILILAEWAQPETVPALLKALQAFCEVERLIPDRSGIARRYWRWCQGRVVYVLGWLGQFDPPGWVEGAESKLQGWKVYLALGYLHAHLTYLDVFTRSLRFLPGLREQVRDVLTEQLGLSEEEQERCLLAYEGLKW